MAPVELHGFRFQFRSFDTTTSVNYNTGLVDRRLTMSGAIEDLKGGQVATVGHAIQLDEVRDERGRDLIALAVLPPGRRAVDDEPASFTMFVEARRLQDGGRFQYSPSGWIAGLPATPRRLSVLRGFVRLLRATKLSTHDIGIEPMRDWRELSPGLSIRITNVEPYGGRLQVVYLVRTTPVEGLLNEAQWLRWYNVEHINAEGERLTQHSGIMGEYNTETGLGNGSLMIDLDPPSLRIETLRITVIDEMELLAIPFEYRDVPLE